MTVSILFWVLYTLAVVFSLATGYEPGRPYVFRNWGGNFLLFALLGLLGVAVFGSPVK